MAALLQAGEGCYDFRSCDHEVLEVVPNITADSMSCRQEEGVVYKTLNIRINGVPMRKTKSYDGIVCRHVDKVEVLSNGKVELTYGFAKIRENSFSADNLIELISTADYGCRENFFFQKGCDEYVAEKDGYKFVGKIDDQYHVSGYCHLPNGRKRHVTNVSECVVL